MKMRKLINNASVSNNVPNASNIVMFGSAP